MQQVVSSSGLLQFSQAQSRVHSQHYILKQLIVFNARADWLVKLRISYGGAFHLLKNSKKSGWGQMENVFFGSPKRKIPRKSGTDWVVPFSRLERPNGNLCAIHRISRLYQQFHAFRGLLRSFHWNWTYTGIFVKLCLLIVCIIGT